MKIRWITVKESSVRAWRIEVPDDMSDDDAEDLFWSNDYESAEPNAVETLNSEVTVTAEPVLTKLSHNNYVEYEA